MLIKSIKLLLLAGMVGLAPLARAETSSTVAVSTIARNPDASTVLPGTIAPSDNFTADDLGVPEPTTFAFILNRLTRLFAISSIRKVALDHERAQMTLLKADQDISDSRTESAIKETARYLALATKTQTELDELTVGEPDKATAAASTIQNITDTKLLDATLLDSLTVKSVGDLNHDLTQAKIQASRDMIKLLEREKLSPAQYQQRLEQINEKLAKKTSQVQKKLAKKLAVATHLQEDGAISDENLNEALTTTENETVQDLAQTANSSADDVATEIEKSFDNSPVILKQIAAKANPLAAKTLNNKIDDSMNTLAKELENAPDGVAQAKLQSTFHRAGDDGQSQELMSKFKDKVKNDKIKKSVEQITTEQDKQDNQDKLLSKSKPETVTRSSDATAKSTSDSTTTDNASKSSSSKSGDTDSSASNTGTGSASPSSGSDSSSASSSSGNSSATHESKTYEIEYKDGAFNVNDVPSGGIAVSDSIKFKNGGDTTIDIESDPHPTHTGNPILNIGSLAKGQTKTVTFASAGTFGFHNHLNPSQSASILVK